MSSSKHRDAAAIASLAGALNDLSASLSGLPESSLVLGELETAILSLLPRTPGSSDLVEAVLSTGRVSLARTLLSAHPEACHGYAPRSPGRVAKWLVQADDDFLGFALAQMPFIDPEQLLLEMVRRDLEGPFRAALAGSGPLAPFKTGSSVLALNIIEACGPRLSGEIARRLSAARAARTATVAALESELLQNADLKPIAVLARAGFDLTRSETLSGTRRLACLQRLIDLGASRHGQMQLIAEEESLEDMLCRDRGGVFFGLRVDLDAQTVRPAGS